MGDPRKQRKKYTGPSHPWEGERIQKENELLRKYGLKNKKEVWRAKSTVGKFRQQARDLLGTIGGEAEKEAKELLNKLTHLGILNNYSLEGVLALTIDDLLGRRLQTIVYKKGIANTVDQARQFVTHRHVVIGNNVVNVPGYIVPREKEEMVQLIGISQSILKKEVEKPPEEEKVEKPPEKVKEKAEKPPEKVKVKAEKPPEKAEKPPEKVKEKAEKPPEKVKEKAEKPPKKVKVEEEKAEKPPEKVKVKAEKPPEKVKVEEEKAEKPPEEVKETKKDEQEGN